MNENLALWNAVERTPPSHTKEITGKSYKGNSPKPHYLIWKATETFGPCGIGWGFTIEDERIEEGAGGERLHIARVKVWFKWGDQRGEVEHIGGTAFCGTRSSGKAFTDEDAPKKSVTDALVKALSMIGFAGDIFMGRYDDNKYLAELREEEKQASQPPAKIDPITPPPAFWNQPSYVFQTVNSAAEYASKMIGAAQKAPNMDCLNKLEEDQRESLNRLRNDSAELHGRIYEQGFNRRKSEFMANGAFEEGKAA